MFHNFPKIPKMSKKSKEFYCKSKIAVGNIYRQRVWRWPMMVFRCAK